MAKIKPTTKVVYDYHELVKLVEAKSGRDVRDWADRWKNQPTHEDYATGNFPQAKWAAKHGYVCNENVWCASKPTPEELALRIKINTEYRDAPDGECLEDKIPYQDFWHYAIDDIFYDIDNGCIRTFSPSISLEEAKAGKKSGQLDKEDWFVIEVLEYFVQVFEENDLPEEIEVEISW